MIKFSPQALETEWEKSFQFVGESVGRNRRWRSKAENTSRHKHTHTHTHTIKHEPASDQHRTRSSIIPMRKRARQDCSGIEILEIGLGARERRQTWRTRYIGDNPPLKYWKNQTCREREERERERECTGVIKYGESIGTVRISTSTCHYLDFRTCTIKLIQWL